MSFLDVSFSAPCALEEQIWSSDEGLNLVISLVLVFWILPRGSADCAVWASEIVILLVL